MGTRIHKMLGWGLTDIAHEGCELTDPRINRDSPLVRYEADYETYMAYLMSTGEKHDIERIVLRDWEKEGKRKPDPQRAFVWNSEFGMGNVLQLRPVWLSDWLRYDNGMDWVEETWLREPYDENGNDRVQVLEHPPHPYTGGYMDVRTGEQFNQRIMEYVRMRGRNRRDPNTFPPDLLETFAQEGAGMSWQEAERFVVPKVPSEIRHLADCFNLFTAEDTWLQLRPMLYVWWA